ncbi:uncharacterized protein LOC123310715 isoform X3 [Coccinella septempunctata]|uniref:uncharacterized protein LOC123310715 isoform X3 n=2 Tax=Coccinella septempunctata TaxID=41139 RepID=UPI001D097857|nr:uncharacterized protein LOC123310715 isoform X3 [Coccinella septempunctata]
MSFILYESKVKNVPVPDTAKKREMECDNQEHVIAEINPEASSTYSATTILNYFQEKMISPYLRLLSLMSLRPLLTIQENSPLLEFVNIFYVTVLMLFMIFGYFLQYMSCFRRDRGFCYLIQNPNIYEGVGVSEKYIQEKICYGSTVFSFILPGSLHLIAYLHAIYVMRSSDDDQISLLMERVILASSNLSNGFIVQKKLMKTLWVFISVSVVWILMSSISIASMTNEGNIDFKWIPESRSPTIDICLKVLLVATILWHDMIEGIIIANYCIQTQLLISYLFFLRERLLQYAVEPIKWMRDIEEFKKMLNYVNSEVATSVSIFTLVNISYAISGILWLLKLDVIDKKTIPILGISLMIILLWIFISTIPFVQAIRLTNACEMLKDVGHKVRIQPFVHSGTPIAELDSVLLFTSTLRIHAKLFSNIVTGSNLLFCLVITCIGILVLGMCHYLAF